MLSCRQERLVVAFGHNNLLSTFGLRPIRLLVPTRYTKGLTSGVRVRLCFAKPNPNSPTAPRLRY